MAIFHEVRGEGPDLVLLHGWGMNSAVFYGVAEALAQHHRVHLLDLPGFGFSQSLEAVPHSLAAWLEQLASELPASCHLLGWSLGGQLATLLALRWPGRVQSLITVASSPCFVAGEGWPGMAPSVLANFARALEQDAGKTIERFLAIQAMGSETAREDIRQLRSRLLDRPLPDGAALALGLELLAHLDLRSDVAQLSQPRLRLYGRLDSLVPVAVAEILAQLDPAGQQHLFHASSHAPFITESAEFVQIVTKFVGELTGNFLS